MVLMSQVHVTSIFQRKSTILNVSMFQTLSSSAIVSVTVKLLQGGGGSVAQWLRCLRYGDAGFKTRSGHSLNLILVVPSSTFQLQL